MNFGGLRYKQGVEQCFFCAVGIRLARLFHHLFLVVHYALYMVRVFWHSCVHVCVLCSCGHGCVLHCPIGHQSLSNHRPIITNHVHRVTFCVMRGFVWDVCVMFCFWCVMCIFMVRHIVRFLLWFFGGCAVDFHDNSAKKTLFHPLLSHYQGTTKNLHGIDHTSGKLNAKIKWHRCISQS